MDITKQNVYDSGVDISMFIRTREPDGFIFYFGSEMGTGSYITGQLLQGNLVVNVYFDGKTEKFQVYTVDLSDGHRHFLRVVRMTNSMMVKVNETVSINHEIPSPTGFLGEKLYLGNWPTEAQLTTTTTTTTTTARYEEVFSKPTTTRRTMASVTTEQYINFTTAGSVFIPATTVGGGGGGGGGVAVEQIDNLVDEGVREFVASPVDENDRGGGSVGGGNIEPSPILQRFRRQLPSTTEFTTSVFFGQERRPRPFKGVILGLCLLYFFFFHFPYFDIFFFFYLIYKNHSLYRCSDCRR